MILIVCNYELWFTLYESDNLNSLYVFSLDVIFFSDFYRKPGFTSVSAFIDTTGLAM